jgi:hypothetical protein
LAGPLTGARESSNEAIIAGRRHWQRKTVGIQGAPPVPASDVQPFIGVYGVKAVINAQTCRPATFGIRRQQEGRVIGSPDFLPMDEAALVGKRLRPSLLPRYPIEVAPQCVTVEVASGASKPDPGCNIENDIDTAAGAAERVHLIVLQASHGNSGGRRRRQHDGCSDQ